MSKIRSEAAEEGVTLLLCVGGGGRSGGFRAVTRERKKRMRLIEDLNGYLAGAKLGGVDFDWERPETKDDWRYFGLLLREAKERLLGGKAVVTFPFHVDGVAQDAFAEFPNILRYADFALAMTYNESESEIGKLVDFWETKKLSLNKLVIGTGFFARHRDTGEAKAYSEVSK